MSEEITISGKSYVSSKRASELSDYTQDYIGQLARAGHIDAQQVGGLWHVSMESLLAYKEKGGEEKSSGLRSGLFNNSNKDPESLVVFGGKAFISASRASEVTGYHQDYVGQLARSGKILSRQVGNRWYVEREGLLNHKKEKDSLLAAVQRDAVGIDAHTESEEQSLSAETKAQDDILSPHFTYVREDGELIPSLQQKEGLINESRTNDLGTSSVVAHDVPIRIIGSASAQDIRGEISQASPITHAMQSNEPFEDAKSSKAPTFRVLTGTAIVAVLLSVGFGAVWVSSHGGLKFSGQEKGTFVASVVGALEGPLTLFERWLVPEIIYSRKD